MDMEDKVETRNARINAHEHRGAKRIYQRNNYPPRPIGDLRDHLNRKRQQQIEQGGPPPDPRYSFLSDPLRENDYTSSSSQDKRDFDEGTSEATVQLNEIKGVRRGRDVSYGQYRVGNFRGRGRARGSVNDNWQHDRFSNNQDGTYLQQPRDDHLFENSNFRGSNYRGQSRSPRRYDNHKSNFSARKFNSNKHFQHLDPMNIKVEFNTDTGERKYTVDKIEMKKKRGRWNYRGRTKRTGPRKNEEHKEINIVSENTESENWDEEENKESGEISYIGPNEELSEENIVDNTPNLLKEIMSEGNDLQENEQKCVDKVTDINKGKEIENIVKEKNSNLPEEELSGKKKKVIEENNLQKNEENCEKGYKITNVDGGKENENIVAKEHSDSSSKEKHLELPKEELSINKELVIDENNLQKNQEKCIGKENKIRNVDEGNEIENILKEKHSNLPNEELSENKGKVTDIGYKITNVDGGKIIENIVAKEEQSDSSSKEKYTNLPNEELFGNKEKIIDEGNKIQNIVLNKQIDSGSKTKSINSPNKVDGNNKQDVNKEKDIAEDKKIENEKEKIEQQDSSSKNSNPLITENKYKENKEDSSADEINKEKEIETQKKIEIPVDKK